MLYTEKNGYDQMQKKIRNCLSAWRSLSKQPSRTADTIESIKDMSLKVVTDASPGDFRREVNFSLS